MEFDRVIQKRTAIRSFQEDKVVEKDKIVKILEAGRLAPTAKNLQPQKIFVISSQEGLAKLDKATPCRYQAPVVLLVCVDRSKVFSKNNHDTAEIDGSIVATHMMLEAGSLGLGSVWISYFDQKKAKTLLNIPENWKSVCMLYIGYPSEDFVPNTHLGGHRKPLNETCFYNDINTNIEV